MGDHCARHLEAAGETVHEGGCLPGGGDGGGNYDIDHDGHDDERGCLPGDGGDDVEMMLVVMIMLIMMMMEDSVYRVLLPSLQVHYQLLQLLSETV